MSAAGHLAQAYSATGAAWQAGPVRIYERLADHLVARSPVPVEGAVVLDLGAGTGAASRAARRAGAGAVVAVDLSLGMLQAAPSREPSAVCDALALPLRTGSVDLAIAAFSLNHLEDPAAGLREAARTVRRGGGLVAGSYATDDAHPVKQAVDQTLAAAGWRPAEWYHWVREHAITQLATEERVRAAAAAAALRSIGIEHLRVPMDDLTPEDLVDWRFGMAQHAEFLGDMEPARRRDLRAAAIEALGDPPPLVRSVLVLTARC